MSRVTSSFVISTIKKCKTGEFQLQLRNSWITRSCTKRQKVFSDNLTGRSAADCQGDELLNYVVYFSDVL